MKELSLYNILKEKAFDEKTKNKVIYLSEIKQIEKYTFIDLFEIVNGYINIFSKLNMKNKRKYVLVNNSVSSIAVFIALLECKAVPVLIDKKNLEQKEHYNKNTNIEYINELKDQLVYDYIDSDVRYFYLSFDNEIFEMKKYLDKIPNINTFFSEEFDDDSKFILCTSGSTSGNSKLVLIKEKELLNKDLSIFNIEDENIFYNYISISSISGVIFSILIPLCLGKKVVLDYYFDLINIDKYNITNLLLPRNILDYLSEIENKKIDFSYVKKIYLSGEINSFEIIKQIRDKIPSIKENVFVNLYGSTETLGVISACDENNLKNIYFSQLHLSKGEIVYTYDKVNVYKIIKSKNKKIVIKANILYDDYGFFECLPVSFSIMDGVEIEKDLGEIIVNGVRTGDVGTYIDNKLYVICRTSEVININETNYFLTAIEKIFNKLTGLKVAAVKIPNQDKIFIAINYILDSNSATNFYDSISLVKKCYDLKNKLLFLPLENPMFIESEQFPKNMALQKTIKKNILKFIPKNKEFEYMVSSYDEALLRKFKSIFESVTGKTTTIENEKNKFKISKSNGQITFLDILKLIKKCYYVDYNEDDNYFYLIVDDCILFNTYPKDKWYIKCENQMEFENHIKNIDSKHNEPNFSEEFNKVLKRIRDDEDKTYCLYLAGIFEYNKSGIMFFPFQIRDTKNIFFNSENRNIDENDNNYGIIEIDNSFKKNRRYYNENELKKKIEYFKKFLNCNYYIDNNHICYIDGVVDEKKICFFVDKLIELYQNKIFFINDKMRICKLDLSINIEFQYLGKKNTIIALNSVFQNKQKWATIDCYLDFNSISYVDSFGCYYSTNYQVESIINKLFIDSNNNPILFVSGLNSYRIKKNDKDSLFNLEVDEKLKRFLKLIKIIENQPNRCIIIDNEEVEIFFSKLKVVYMVLDEALYKEPTISQYLELNYPKEILKDDTKIYSYMGLLNEYKNSKIKKKVR